MKPPLGGISSGNIRTVCQEYGACQEKGRSPAHCAWQVPAGAHLDHAGMHDGIPTLARGHAEYGEQRGCEGLKVGVFVQGAVPRDVLAGRPTARSGQSLKHVTKSPLSVLGFWL